MNKEFIQFHRPFITEDEVAEVADSIRSGWWTTGPKTLRFEQEFNHFIGSKFSISANSWTASAHLALEAFNLQENDEVIIPAMTFTATAEIICYFRAKPVIVDVQEDTFNIDPDQIEKSITNKTKAVIPVHYSGQPCDMDEISGLSKKNNIKIIEDAAHALPAYYKNKKIGTIGDVTCFSFYATKTLATGEGGMICTDDEQIARRCSIMRLHGINKDAWKRYSSEGTWYYEVVSPGFKYNFTDIQASLGLAQLKKIDRMLNLRKDIFNKYNSAFNDNPLIKLYKIKEDRESAHHLYPILLDIDNLTITRAEFIIKLKELGIGTSVHFIPLYRHPFYRDFLNLTPKMFPVSEYIYERVITLPIWPGMTDSQIYRVTEAVNNISKKYKK